MSSSGLSSPTEEMIEYVNAARTASSKGRSVLVVLITASVLACISEWNITGISGTQNTLVSANNRVKSCEQRYDTNPSLISPNLNLSRIAYSNNGNMVPAYVQNRSDFYRSASFTNQDACKEDQNQLADLTELSVTAVNSIRIPFFNCIIDIHDLWLVSGFTFFIALIWLRSVLWKERDNIDVIFTTYRNHGTLHMLEAAYNLLSMHQNLMAPEEISQEGLFSKEKLLKEMEDRLGKYVSWFLKMFIYKDPIMYFITPICSLLAFLTGNRSSTLTGDCSSIKKGKIGRIKRSLAHSFVYFMCSMPALVQMYIFIADCRRTGTITQKILLELMLLLADMYGSRVCIAQLILTNATWDKQRMYIMKLAQEHPECS
jgi:hypothetical protein